VGFADGGEFNEIEAARRVAAHLDAPHHHVVIGQDDFVAALPELARGSDEPLADLAAVPLFFVCRLAREHVKVVLSGEGSDETQAGYEMAQTARRLEQLRRLDRLLPGPGLRLLAQALPAPQSHTIRDLGAAGWSGVLRAGPRHITFHWSEAEKRALWRRPAPRVPTDGLIRSWYDLATSGHPLDQMQEVYCRSWLPDDLLRKADAMSMASSLELRVPYLDARLVDWVQRVPVSWRVGDRRGGYRSKRLVREFARTRLPRATVEQAKRGFPVPAHRWLAGDGGAWAETLLVRGAARINDLLNVDRLAPVVRSAAAGDRRAADCIWTLIVLEYWLRAWQ
jgi:asparagine synthase (glutamine-hydrolysing)